MARLILFILLIAALALAVASVAAALRVVAPAGAHKGDTMPKTFSTIAYVLLIILMFGVATGWLGAA